MTKLQKLGCAIAMSLGLLGACGAPEVTNTPSQNGAPSSMTIQLNEERTAMSVQEGTEAEVASLPNLGTNESDDGEAARCSVTLNYCKDPRTGSGTCSCKGCTATSCLSNCVSLYCKVCTTKC